jgi:hypothetical protein
MDQGVVMLNFAKGSPLIAALITTKSSRSLWFSLSTFVTAFTSEFKAAIESGAHTESEFMSALGLVKQCFPYIPEYK